LEPFTPIDLESIGMSSDELTLMVMRPASYADDNFNFRLTESALSNTFSAKQSQIDSPIAEEEQCHTI
jgi:hypothetical protein